MVFIKEKEIAFCKTLFLTFEMAIFLSPCVLEDLNQRITLYIFYYLLFYKLNIHSSYEYHKNNTITYYENL
jgi:hypothetical protein